MAAVGESDKHHHLYRFWRSEVIELFLHPSKRPSLGHQHRIPNRSNTATQIVVKNWIHGEEKPSQGINIITLHLDKSCLIAVSQRLPHNGALPVV